VSSTFSLLTLLRLYILKLFVERAPRSGLSEGASTEWPLAGSDFHYQPEVLPLNTLPKNSNFIFFGNN
jgi:hypothetical protein